MANLKRYEPCTTGSAFIGMQEVNGGEWVKFADIKEFLPTANNKQSTPCLVHGDHVHSYTVIICDACGEKL